MTAGGKLLRCSRARVNKPDGQFHYKFGCFIFEAPNCVGIIYVEIMFYGRQTDMVDKILFIRNYNEELIIHFVQRKYYFAEGGLSTKKKIQKHLLFECTYVVFENFLY